MIDKRQESIELLDKLLRATFLDMFGDPVSNPKGWEYKSLNEFGSFKNGLNYSSYEKGLEIHCIGVGDFKSLWKISDTEINSKISLEQMPSQEYFLKNGDLLFVRSNGNKELVGRCVVVYPDVKEVTFSGFCIRYRITDSRIKSTYLAHLFRVSVFRKAMLQKGRGANIQNINQKLLGELRIPFPPVELQLQFETSINKFVQVHDRVAKSQADIESLFQALLQRAFHGDLNFDIDLQLDAFLSSEDVDAIAKDDVFIQRLIDRFNQHNQQNGETTGEERPFKFVSSEDYEKAKKILFNLMKDNKVGQVYDKEAKKTTIEML